MPTMTQEEYSLVKSINFLSKNTALQKEHGNIVSKFLFFFGGLFILGAIPMFYGMIFGDDKIVGIGIIFLMVICFIGSMSLALINAHLGEINKARENKLGELKTLLSTLVSLQHTVSVQKEELLYISNYDKNSQGINPEVLEKIKIIIKEISNNIGEINSRISSIQPNNFKRGFNFSLNRELIPYNTNEISKKEILPSYIQYIKEKEQEKLVELITSFKKELSDWIRIHKEELEKYEENIETQADITQNTDGKVALEAQKVRLQSYIENINRLTK